MVRVNISIPDDTLKKVDKYKQLTSLTRSGLIMKALEKYFTELESKILEERKKEAVRNIIKIRDKIGGELRGWDSTGEIKKLRDSRWKGQSKNNGP